MIKLMDLGRDNFHVPPEIVVDLIKYDLSENMTDATSSNVLTYITAAERVFNARKAAGSEISFDFSLTTVSIFMDTSQAFLSFESEREDTEKILRYNLKTSQNVSRKYPRIIDTVLVPQILEMLLKCCKKDAYPRMSVTMPCIDVLSNLISTPSDVRKCFPIIIKNGFLDLFHVGFDLLRLDETTRKERSIDLSYLKWHLKILKTFSCVITALKVSIILS